jgi:hypothetical protein
MTIETVLATPNSKLNSSCKLIWAVLHIAPFKILSTPQIHYATGLSRRAVDKNMILLKKKKLVRVVEHQSGGPCYYEVTGALIV